ncbi:MAG: carboxypeptidase-like regulatory domain-containing protein, partial [Bryobacteraceae bacterium]|nr:carboxypeptidase-like regulatory domain-containing protein [Bryobacteraceae bacterium]
MLWQLILLIRVGGQVVDPGQGSVKEAEIQLRTAQGTPVAVTRTDADGKFAFETPGSGEFLIRVEAPGFASAERKAEERMIVTLEV